MPLMNPSLMTTTFVAFVTEPVVVVFAIVARTVIAVGTVVVAMESSLRAVAVAALPLLRLMVMGGSRS